MLVGGNFEKNKRRRKERAKISLLKVRNSVAHRVKSPMCRKGYKHAAVLRKCYRTCCGERKNLKKENENEFEEIVQRIGIFPSVYEC